MSALPSGLSIASDTGDIQGTPDPGTAGDYTVTIIVVDMLAPAFWDSATFKMTVN